ncbi:S26 family signal peptidase [Nonomuraea sp. NPDC005983]|uniref:S26 family signal peptidase n=1 Tax=Nonomuraea sp. NPDC005983 TaxID=3155595 RepID=UPI0033BD3EFF
MKRGKLLLPVYGALALGASLWWIRRNYLVATVEGPSMEPTFHSGDRLLVRRAKRVRTGQIVVVRIPDPPMLYEPPPGLEPGTEAGTEPGTKAELPERDHLGWRLLVKRVAAAPGDPVPTERFPALRDVLETVVPPRALVVLGDNPDTSWDSRAFGFVRSDQLVGVMVRRLPPSASVRRSPDHPART